MCNKNAELLVTFYKQKYKLPSLKKVRCVELGFILGRVRWEEIGAPVCADSECLVVDDLATEP